MKVKAFYKRPDDGIAVIRISAGQGDNGECYIVYRGNLSDVKKTMQCINDFIQKQTKEAQSDPRDYSN